MNSKYPIAVTHMKMKEGTIKWQAQNKTEGKKLNITVEFITNTLYASKSTRVEEPENST